MLRRDAGRLQRVDGGPRRAAEDPEQEMLGPDEGATALCCERRSAVDRVRELRDGDKPVGFPAFVRRRGGADPRNEAHEVDAELLPNASHPRRMVGNKREQKLLGPDVPAVASPSLPVRARQDPTGVCVETVERTDRRPSRVRVGRATFTAHPGRSGVADSLLPKRGDHLMTDLLDRYAQRLENTRSVALALVQEPEQQVLRADVTMAELPRLVDRELDDLLRARRERDLAPRGRAIPAADRELDAGANLRQLYTEGIEGPRRHTFTLADQAEKEMLDPDVVVVQEHSLVLGERENSLGAIVEAVEGAHPRGATPPWPGPR